MRENRLSSLMSGEWKRSITPPRHSSTLLVTHASRGRLLSDGSDRERGFSIVILGRIVHTGRCGASGSCERKWPGFGCVPSPPMNALTSGACQLDDNRGARLVIRDSHWDAGARLPGATT